MRYISLWFVVTINYLSGLFVGVGRVESKSERWSDGGARGVERMWQEHVRSAHSEILRPHQRTGARHVTVADK